MKKILSIALVAVLLLSVFAFSATAAQVKKDVAPTGEGTVINFDNSVTNWEGPVQFYVYDPEIGEEIIAWGSKMLNGEDNGDGTWSYDASVMNLDSDKQYCIIFHDLATGAQTYDLLFDASCFGDTAVVSEDERVENPVDSSKWCYEARWRTETFIGPRLQVTSIGNVVGDTCPTFTTPYDIYVEFLMDKLDNARMYSGKDDQALLDDTAAALGLNRTDILLAIHETGVVTEWDASKSYLPTDSDIDGDSYTPSASGSGSSGSSSSIPGSTPDYATAATSDSSSRSGSGSGSDSGSGSGSGSGSSSTTSPKTGYSAELYLIVLLILFATICAGVSVYKIAKKRG